MSHVTRILSAIEDGDPDAAEQLLPLVYDELRKLAAQKMAQESPGQTLQATALVHEAYVRLVEHRAASALEQPGPFLLGSRRGDATDPRRSRSAQTASKTGSEISPARRSARSATRRGTSRSRRSTRDSRSTRASGRKIRSPGRVGQASLLPWMHNSRIRRDPGGRSSNCRRRLDVRQSLAPSGVTSRSGRKSAEIKESHLGLAFGCRTE